MCLITLRMSSISAIDHVLWLHKTLKTASFSNMVLQTPSSWPYDIFSNRFSCFSSGHISVPKIQRLSFSKHGTRQLCPGLKTYSYDFCLSLIVSPRHVVHLSRFLKGCVTHCCFGHAMLDTKVLWMCVS